MKGDANTVFSSKHMVTTTTLLFDYPNFSHFSPTFENCPNFQGFYNPAAYELIPCIMETSGRMNPAFKRLLGEVATFASRHLPTGGVGQQRFRARFLKFWKSKLTVTFLGSLGRSAMRTQRDMLERLPNNSSVSRIVDIF